MRGRVHAAVLSSFRRRQGASGSLAEDVARCLMQSCRASVVVSGSGDSGAAGDAILCAGLLGVTAALAV